jgi:hypothetical protein
MTYGCGKYPWEERTSGREEEEVVRGPYVEDRRRIRTVYVCQGARVVLFTKLWMPYKSTHTWFVRSFASVECRVAL